MLPDLSSNEPPSFARAPSVTASLMPAGSFVPLRVASSSIWPLARAEMTEPGLIVFRLAEDVAELFDDEGELTVDALVALGWPRDIAAQYFGVASQHAATMVASQLEQRRRAGAAMRRHAPIPLEPTEEESEQALALRSESASPSELRVFLFGMIGGGLIGALLAISFFSFAEALR